MSCLLEQLTPDLNNIYFCQLPGLIWFIFSMTYAPLALKMEDTFSRVDEDLTSAVISFRTLVRVAGFALMREDYEHKTLKLENVP
jgi:hypothetical protein